MAKGGPREYHPGSEAPSNGLKQAFDRFSVSGHFQEFKECFAAGGPSPRVKKERKDLGTKKKNDA